MNHNSWIRLRRCKRGWVTKPDMILKTSANTQQTILIFGKSSSSLLKNFVVKIQFIYSITNPTAISIIAFFIRPPIKISTYIWMVFFMVSVALLALTFRIGSTLSLRVIPYDSYHNAVMGSNESFGVIAWGQSLWFIRRDQVPIPIWFKPLVLTLKKTSKAFPNDKKAKNRIISSNEIFIAEKRDIMQLRLRKYDPGRINNL